MIQKPVIKTILDILYQCGGNQLAENTLFTYVNMELDAMAVSTGDLKTHLNHCKDKGWIDYNTDPLSGPDKWFLTERGKVVRA